MNNSSYRQAAARICICDSEVSYGEHLMEYLKRAGQLPFDIYLYTSKEVFMARESPEKVKLLVIAESQYGEEVEKAGFVRILLLNESSTYIEKPENMSKFETKSGRCAWRERVISCRVCVMESQ